MSTIVEQVAALAALRQKATSGPWYDNTQNVTKGEWAHVFGPSSETHTECLHLPNAAFIAAAGSLDFAALLAALPTPPATVEAGGAESLAQLEVEGKPIGAAEVKAAAQAYVAARKKHFATGLEATRVQGGFIEGVAWLARQVAPQLHAAPALLARLRRAEAAAALQQLAGGGAGGELEIVTAQLERVSEALGYAHAQLRALGIEPATPSQGKEVAND